MINTICEIMMISRSAYFKFKKENRPIIFLLEKYFSKEDLDEFLKTKSIRKYDLIKNLSNEEISNIEESKESLFLLEDFAHYSLVNKLVKFFSFFDLPDFTKHFSKKILKQIIHDVHNDHNFTRHNAKELLLSALRGYVTSLKRLEHPNHPVILIDFINNDFSRIEAYLLVKDYEKYIKAI